MVTTPTLRELMDDPVYRAYMKRVPPAWAIHGLTYGDPWQVWLKTARGTWKTGRFPSYRDVWPKVVAGLRSDDTTDVALVSRRVFFAPPGEYYTVKVKRTPTAANPKPFRIETRWRPVFHWDAGLEWCGRCRRPSWFARLPAKHHAIRTHPTVALEGDPARCVYCGIRREAQPGILHMERIERP